MTLARMRLAAVAALVVASMPVAFAQTPAAEEAFKAGLSHQDARRWAPMAQQMRLAIQNDSRETTKKIGRGLSGVFGGGTEYLPYYFLGLALFNQGTSNCVVAMDQWALSESQGVIRQVRDYVQKVQDGYGQCEKAGFLRPSTYEARNKEVMAAYESVRGTAARTTELVDANRAILRQDAVDVNGTALKELAAAHEKLVAGQRSHLAVDFTDAKGLIDRVNAALRTVSAELTAATERATNASRARAEAERNITEAESHVRALDPISAQLSIPLREQRDNGTVQLNRARTQLADAGQDQERTNLALGYSRAAVSTLGDVVTKSQQFLRESTLKQLSEAVKLASDKFPYVQSSLAVVDRLVQERPAVVRPEVLVERQKVDDEVKSLRRRLDRAQQAEQLARVQGIDRELILLLGRIDVLMKSFGPVTLRDRGVVAALEEGARQFLAGQYAETVTALDPIVNGGGGALQIHVHLLRAASEFALYVRGGERDARRRQSAVAEVERAKQLDPAFIPDATRFSPRFIEFYRQPNPPAAAAKAATR